MDILYHRLLHIGVLIVCGLIMAACSQVLYQTPFTPFSTLFLENPLHCSLTLLDLLYPTRLPPSSSRIILPHSPTQVLGIIGALDPHTHKINQASLKVGESQ